MTRTQKKYETFINGMITHGDQIKAYMEAYPGAKPDSARVASYTLLRNNTISTRIKEAAERVRIQVEGRSIEEMKDNFVRQVMEANMKRSILFKIAHGEMELERVFLGRNGTEMKLRVKPDYADILKAIDLDNKMTGDYAPEKKEISAPIEKKNRTPEEIEASLFKSMSILYPDADLSFIMPPHLPGNGISDTL